MLHTISRLTKAPLCSMVALSALFGYSLVPTAIFASSVTVTIGVFFLACGAAALNSIQERHYDARFARTSTRPLVTGALSLKAGWTVTTACLLTGSILLFLSGQNLLPLAIGLTALVIYNGIYTPLKPVSSFALLPGGVAGALPPFIGWVAAGGDVTAPLILFIMALFFLWQPPHFCLLLMAHKKEYEKSQTFTTLLNRFSTTKIKKIITIWLLSYTAIVILLSCLPNIIAFEIQRVLIVIAPLFFAVFFIYLFMNRKPKYKLLFVSLNSFMVSLMFLLTIGVTMQV